MHDETPARNGSRSKSAVVKGTEEGFLTTTNEQLNGTYLRRSVVPRALNTGVQAAWERHVAVVCRVGPVCLPPRDGVIPDAWLASVGRFEVNDNRGGAYLVTENMIGIRRRGTCGINS